MQQNKISNHVLNKVEDDNQHPWFLSDCHSIHMLTFTYTRVCTCKYTVIHRDKNLSIFKVPVLPVTQVELSKLMKCFCFKTIRALVVWGYKSNEYGHKMKCCSLLSTKKCLTSDLVNNWADKSKVSPYNMLSEGCFPLRVLREKMNLNYLSEASIPFSADGTCLTHVGPMHPC